MAGHRRSGRGLKMEISVIAAVAADGCIGRGGELPWRIPADLRRFRQLTLGKPVIMGRKTWESLPRRPLDGRLNIVLTRRPGTLDGATAVASLDAALAVAAASGAAEAAVIGGGEVYALAMPLATRLFLTEVGVSVDGGDAFFPPWRRSDWTELSHEPLSASPPAAFRALRRGH